MAISIAWPTSVIYIPRADLALIQTTPTEIRELNINSFRLALKDLEDSAEGITFLKTHTHNTEVALGGLTYARVVEILVPYTITFEDGQYAVNLVGANSNVGDRVNVNQVSVRSANSAGLTSAPAMEYSSFNGGVTVDITSSYAGTVFPIGTPQKPVNNLTDAKLIASYRGFTKFYIISSMAINTSGIYNNFIFEGESINKTKLTIYTDAEVLGCQFMYAEIEGILDGQSYIENCRIGDLAFVDGIIQNSILLANYTIALSSTRYANFVNCVAGRLDSPSDTPPTIDMGGSGTSLALRNYNGELVLTNKDGLDNVSIDLNSGVLILDSTITAGTIQVRGVGELIDYSSGVIINTSGLINKQTEYNGVVYICTSCGTAGTGYGIGTINNPVNNLTDALVILARENFDQLKVQGQLTIDQNLSDIEIHGLQHLIVYTGESDLINLNGKIFTNVGFGNITLSGSMLGSSGIKMHDCYINEVKGLSGSAENCSISSSEGESCSIEAGAYFSSVNTIFEGDFTTIDMQSTTGTIASLDIDSGYVNFINSVDGCLIEVNMRGGELELDASCTGGDFYAEGYGTLFGDPEALGMTVKANHLIALETIEAQVLDAQTSEHVIVGSVGKALSTAGSALNEEQNEQLMNTLTEDNFLALK